MIINGRRRPCFERHESVINDINGSVMTSRDRARAMNKLEVGLSRSGWSGWSGW